VPRRGKPDPVARRFGAAAREVRHARSETLEDVARRIRGMDAKYLGEVERGWHSPTITTAKRIADALDVPLAELVEDI
jgi:XRE family transcriptional regulator, regulator of sulfur utilization